MPVWEEGGHTCGSRLQQPYVKYVLERGSFGARRSPSGVVHGVNAALSMPAICELVAPRKGSQDGGV